MSDSKNIRPQSEMTQLILTLSMLITEGITLSDDQIQAIRRILWCAIDPSVQIGLGFALPTAPSVGQEDLVRGIAELAAFIGTSIPTAQKLKNEGRFDEARLDFGSRKLVWSKAKLMELAKKNK